MKKRDWEEVKGEEEGGRRRGRRRRGRRRRGRPAGRRRRSYNEGAEDIQNDKTSNDIITILRASRGTAVERNGQFSMEGKVLFQT